MTDRLISCFCLSSLLLCQSALYLCLSTFAALLDTRPRGIWHLPGGLSVGVVSASDLLVLPAQESPSITMERVTSVS